MRLDKKFLEKVKSSVKESKHIEFKEMLDVASDHDWCEITKDIVALANSDGGCILIGVRNDGTPAQLDPDLINKLDSAKFVDKMFKYTGVQFSLIEIAKIVYQGNDVIALYIQGSNLPLVFSRKGSYLDSTGKEKNAFNVGTVYFRHGAKSEPGNSSDVYDAIEKEIDRRRRSWLGNIRKVIQAPADHVVKVLPGKGSTIDTSNLSLIRITDDSNAPLVRYQTPDAEHPLRQRDVIRFVNDRLAGVKTVNARDMLCIRRTQQIDHSKPQFYYKALTGSAQYSYEYVDWLIKSYEKDSQFFDKARTEYSKLP